jgi:hypothetical protein
MNGLFLLPVPVAQAFQPVGYEEEFVPPQDEGLCRLEDTGQKPVPPCHEKFLYFPMKRKP